LQGNANIDQVPDKHQICKRAHDGKRHMQSPSRAKTIALARIAPMQGSAHTGRQETQWITLAGKQVLAEPFPGRSPLQGSTHARQVPNLAPDLQAEPARGMNNTSIAFLSRCDHGPARCLPRKSSMARLTYAS